jgi:ribosomal protein S12 methylthiotransferase
MPSRPPDATVEVSRLEGGLMPKGRYWLQTLGCPKNQVDSDKLAGLLETDGFVPSTSPEKADLVVVNTCAFIEAARQESIETVLELAGTRRAGARLVVTGCMAERYGDELVTALPEVDLVAGFGRRLTPPGGEPAAVASRAQERAAPTSVTLAPAASVKVALGVPRHRTTPSPALESFDLLSLPRPASAAPWAYVKVAEGCDRRCGFCAIPSFRGTQRSRPPADVLAEVQSLASARAMPVKEVVLVAQDLASYGRDRTGRPVGARRVGRPTPLVSLVEAVAEIVPRTRLLYLYPSGLTAELVEAVLATGVPYFDLSLQHVSRPLLARMRRWGDAERFLERIAVIRRAEPRATFRSSFILGYPGETEEDHDELLAFLDAAQLDWAGFFTFSKEAGTAAAKLDRQVPEELALERLRECVELQDTITALRRDALVGEVREVLVDAPGRGRTVHEAPEIDGIVRLPASLPVGSTADVEVTASLGVDLVGAPVGAGR